MTKVLSGAREATQAAVARLTPHRDRAIDPADGRGRVVQFEYALRRGRDRLVGARSAPMPADRTALARLLFGATPFLYIAQQLLTRPRSILGGEMYAEMSSNYYATTQMMGARLQLLAVDAGYIPLPQRIIGLVGWALGLPPGAIPYYYTGTALVLTALLIGSICLPAFRPLIGNDVLRFALSAAILLVLDFETRGYINFTYVVVVPAVFIGALALVGREVPRWAWILPILLISKPAVLTALPIIVVAALVSGRRFRAIAAVSLLAAAVQVVRLAISSTLPGSLLQQAPTAPLPEKVVTAAKYTLGFIGRFVLSPNGGQPSAASTAAGALVLIAFVVVALLGRSRASAVIVAGLSLVAADMLLNSVVYANWFTSDLAMTLMVGFDRRVVVAMIGVLIAAAGVGAVVTESPLTRSALGRATRFAGTRLRPAVGPVLRVAAIVVFVGWLGASGWIRYSAGINNQNVAPSTDVSKWQTMAPALASGQPVVCIPTAPFGWAAYGRGCESLGVGVPASLEFRPILRQASGAYAVALRAPDEVRDRTLSAISMIVQPTQAEQVVRATVTVTSSSGTRTVLGSTETLPLTGGAMLFENMPANLIEQPRTISIVFDGPVRVGWVPNGSGGTAIAMHWMGR